MSNIIIPGEHKPVENKANNKKVFFPKKSHNGYFDKTFRRKFYSERGKREFMNKQGWVESGETISKAHTRRVDDFVKWVKDEKRKNPNFEKTKIYKNEKYPD